MIRSADRPRAIYDCNLLVQAIAFTNGPAATCLDLVESNKITLFVSKSTLAELRRVLTYPEILALSSNMTSERITAFMHRLLFRATLVRRIPNVFHYPRDPHDEPYINLAIAAKADYLVTRDRDLLDLMIGHSFLHKNFRQKTRPLQVLDPATFIKILN